VGFNKIKYMKECLEIIDNFRKMKYGDEMHCVEMLEYTYKMYFRVKAGWACIFCEKPLPPTYEDKTCDKCWEVTYRLEDFLDSEPAFNHATKIMGIEFECDWCFHNFNFSSAKYEIGDKYRFVLCPNCGHHKFSCVARPNKKNKQKE